MESEPQRKRSVLLSWLRRGLWVLAGLALAALAWQVLTWPDVARLRDVDPDTTAFIERYRSERRAAGLDAGVAWRWVDYERISIELKHAVLVSEDIGFFDHRGFALDEVKIALREALREREPPRGASTITQQLAKNLWLSPRRSPLRKLEEAILTRQLERHLDKRRILELYLNVVEFGHGIYGVEAAARRYFGKAALDLTEREAAMLAASLPRPSTWHPGVERESYQRYVEEVLRRMERAEFLWRYFTPPPLLQSLPSAPVPSATPVDSTATPSG